MSYWSTEIDGCDYAFDAVGASLSWIKQRLFKELEIAIEKEYPEQSVGAYVCLLRVTGARFPKQLAVVFGRRDLERARQGFERWYTLVEEKLPLQGRNQIRENTEREFALFEEEHFRAG
jgi:hypothetical protein